jgi:hypothetical protein
VKSLGLAFFIVVAAAALLFWVMGLFGIQDKIAGPISGALFGAITYVQQTLDKGRSGRGFGLLPATVVQFKDYTISQLKMITYFALVLAGAMQLSSFLGGFAGGLAGLELSNLLVVLLLSSVLINGTTAFLLGMWIGKRCRDHKILCVVLGAIAGSTIGHGVDFLVLSKENFEELFQETFDTGFILTKFTFGAAIFTLVALIGCWKGNSLRLSAYLHYLLKRVPTDTRDVLVSMAYDEASKLATQRQ